MTVAFWQADGTQPTREVDFLVVGAGLVGCAAAYFAAQAGRQVVITEARDLALGASGRNAGFMITGLDTYYHRAIERFGPEITRSAWALSRRTHAHWQMFAKKGSVPLVNCGSLLLAESEGEADELALAVEALHADNIPVVHHRQDPLGRGYYAGIEQPWDCAVHPARLTQAIYQQSGAMLIANNEVYAIDQTDEARVTVYTRQYRLQARHVLLCTNAYSARLHPYFADKITPTRAQCLVTEPLPTPLLTTCGYSDYGYMYYRMTFDNRLLVGGGRQHHQAAEDDTAEDRTTPELQATLEAYCRQHFPEAVGDDGAVRVARRWAGIMGFTPDSIPLVGTLPDMPRVGFAVGFTGHGLALGAGTAEQAVAHLLEGTDPGFLSVARLARLGLPSTGQALN
jgi:gamma-glutamylputrescine oxidase